MYIKSCLISGLFLILIFLGCQQERYTNLQQVLLSSIEPDSLKNIDYIVIIPQEGCEGCISFAEEFYNSYNNYPGIKYVLTNIISEKKLRKRLKVTPETIIDREGVYFSILRDSESIYPAVIALHDGLIKEVKFQSPDEDALIDLEKIISKDSNED